MISRWQHICYTTMPSSARLVLPVLPAFFAAYHTGLQLIFLYFCQAPHAINQILPDESNGHFLRGSSHGSYSRLLALSSPCLYYHGVMMSACSSPEYTSELTDAAKPMRIGAFSQHQYVSYVFYQMSPRDAATSSADFRFSQRRAYSLFSARGHYEDEHDFFHREHSDGRVLYAGVHQSTKAADP